MMTRLLSLGVAALFAAIPVSSTVSTDTHRALWKDPGPIASRDLFWGAGAPDRVPKVPFTFIAENTTGTKPKIDVRDAAGVSWSVKLAGTKPENNEVHAEIAATRLLWALGYFVDENYFVPEGRIEGVQGLTRAAAVVGADGSFRVARFERRPPEAVATGGWDIEDNRFKGTRELTGLHVLMMLLGNWDLKTTNNVILRLPLENGDAEERYLVSDLGSSFGRMRGGVGDSVSRWDLDGFRNTAFVDGIVMGQLQFRGALNGNRPLTIPLAHAQWFSQLSSQLTEEQIRRAFEASGASPDEVAGFTAEIRTRLSALREALNGK